LLLDEDGETLLIHLRDKNVLLFHLMILKILKIPQKASCGQEDEGVGSGIARFLMSGAF